ncbi:hypothetical protein HDU83_000444 [Entophlyctis luteolus]|nr:hypothetical protein HDU83_000444 [Entophlyctis luteolus]KAJ3387889.1 hypothetical protein HDU84_000425 [Entophlyctis sp. JEL0112]
MTAVNVTTNWCDGSTFNVVVNSVGMACTNAAAVMSSFASVGGYSCWGPSGSQFWCSVTSGCPSAATVVSLFAACCSWFFSELVIQASLPICISVVAHTAVYPFEEVTPSTNEEIAAARFKPYLTVIQNAYPGCAIFPSVDTAGNVGAGLKLGGATNGDCATAPNGGQVYVRSAQYQDRWAIMYAWYAPKDQEMFGYGHRHEWECTVVFINDVNASAANQQVIEVAASAHGSFRQYTPPNPDVMEGTHAHIKYFTDGIKDHATDTYDNPPSGESPELKLIHWHQLTPAAQFVLQNYDYGDANVPFKDANFVNNLAKAYL